jgi:hypothetical protein
MVVSIQATEEAETRYASIKIEIFPLKSLHLTLNTLFGEEKTDDLESCLETSLVWIKLQTEDLGIIDPALFGISYHPCFG